MKRFLLGLLAFILIFPSQVKAHIGSPDIFYDGKVGPWSARVTIRMPEVVPGRASLFVQVDSKEPLTVSFTPLATGVAVSNAPPPEMARVVEGESNLYTGELWLMTVGAYSIHVRLHGPLGDGSVLIPIDSIARSQLPLPPWLGQILLLLGAILFCSALAIVAAAAGEASVPLGSSPDRRDRFKYWTAVVVSCAVFVTALAGGWRWWMAEESDFRDSLQQGGWPDIQGEVRTDGPQRILRVTFDDSLSLAPDHGKLLHLFLTSLPDRQAFAHLHPRPAGDKSFEVALPVLPSGDYEMFCDLTLDSGRSSTATNIIHLLPPPAKASTNSALALKPDPDDSWLVSPTATAQTTQILGNDALCCTPGGTQIVWKEHPSEQANHDAALQFQVEDQEGQPVHLEPYMGMMGHAAVIRSDGRVFTHLHPSGNYSMAAQFVFDGKMASEIGATNAAAIASSKAKDSSIPDEWCGPIPPGAKTSLISFPYEFPSPGDYKVWVQVKTGGKIVTAVFDAKVI